MAKSIEQIIDLYEIVDGDVKDTEISASTKIGESIGENGKKVIETEVVSVSIPIPATLPALLKTLGAERVVYYVTSLVKIRLADHLRKNLKEELELAEKENRTLNLAGVQDCLTPENWISLLSTGTERKKTGGRKVVEAVRVATKAEKTKSLAAIRGVLEATGADINNLSDAVKASLEASYGYSNLFE